MKDENYARAYSVKDPEQAKLLSDPKSFHYFQPFLAQTNTVSHAAAELGCNLDTLLYRVRTFLKAELLQIIHVEKRAGRAIKHYRSSHDSYFVPLSSTPHSSYEEEVRQVLHMYEDDIAKALARTKRTLDRPGIRIHRNERGEVSSHSAADKEHLIDYDSLPMLPQSPEFANISVAEIFTDTLSLNDSEAKRLLSDLYKLWRENKRETSSDRTPYLLRVIMVPLEPS